MIQSIFLQKTNNIFKIIMKIIKKFTIHKLILSIINLKLFIQENFNYINSFFFNQRNMIVS